MNVRRGGRIFKSSVILFNGLKFVGFEEERQHVCMTTKLQRFRSAFGVGPKAVEALLNDLVLTFPSLSLKDTPMAMNWLTCYQNDNMNAGLWKYNETTVGAKIKEYVTKIQSLKPMKIVMGNFGPEE